MITELTRFIRKAKFIVIAMFLYNSCSTEVDSEHSAVQVDQSSGACLEQDFKLPPKVDVLNVSAAKILSFRQSNNLLEYPSINLKLGKKNNRCPTYHIKFDCQNKKACRETMTTKESIVFPILDSQVIQANVRCCVPKELVDPDTADKAGSPLNLLGHNYFCGKETHSKKIATIDKKPDMDKSCQIYWEEVFKNRELIIDESIKICRLLKKQDSLSIGSKKHFDMFEQLSCLHFAEEMYEKFSKDELENILGHLNAPKKSLALAGQSSSQCTNRQRLEDLYALQTPSASQGLNLSADLGSPESQKSTRGEPLQLAGSLNSKDRIKDGDNFSNAFCTNKYKNLGVLASRKWKGENVTVMTTGVAVFAVGVAAGALFLAAGLTKNILYDLPSAAITGKHTPWGRSRFLRKLGDADLKIKNKMKELNVFVNKTKDRKKISKLKKELDALVRQRSKIEGFATTKKRLLKKSKGISYIDDVEGYLIDRKIEKLEIRKSDGKLKKPKKVGSQINELREIRSKLKVPYSERSFNRKQLARKTKIEADLGFRGPKKKRISTAYKGAMGSFTVAAIGAGATYFSGTMGLSSANSGGKKTDKARIRQETIKLLAYLKRRNELLTTMDILCDSASPE